jgi:hypothetical protein
MQPAKHAADGQQQQDGVLDDGGLVRGGVLPTATPYRVQRSTSMRSRPMPMRWTIFKFLPASSTSG